MNSHVATDARLAVGRRAADLVRWRGIAGDRAMLLVVLARARVYEFR